MARGIPSPVSPHDLLPLRLLWPIIAAVVFLASLASLNRPSVSMAVLWMGIHLVALTAAGLPVIVAKATFLHRKVQSVPFWMVIASGILIGLLKALFTAFLEGALGLAEDWTSNLGIRVLGASFVAVWVVGLSSYAQAGIRQLQQARENLIRQNVTARLRATPSTRGFDAEQSLLTLRALRDSIGATPQKELARDVRTLVDETIKPLSKELWSLENKRYPRITFRNFVAVSLSSGRLRSSWIVGLWASTSFLSVYITHGLAASAVTTATIGAIALVLWHLAPRFLPRSHLGALAVIAGVSITAVAGGMAFSRLIAPGLVLPGSLGQLFIGALWMTLAVTGVSALSGAFEIARVIRHDRQLGHTKELIEQQAKNALLIENARNTAKQLHGEVQSRLLALAAAIDTKGLDKHAIGAEIDSVIEALSTLGHSSAHSQLTEERDGATTRLQRLMDSWAGLLSVEIDRHSSSQLLTAAETTPELIDIIREGLNNAHRHGNATTATISFSQDTTHSILTVTDDGYGPTEGEPGLGSALLDHWSDGRWQLTPSDRGGSTLRVELSIGSKATTLPS